MAGGSAWVVAAQLPQVALDRLIDDGGAPPAVRVIFFDPIHGAITRFRPDATSFPHRPLEELALD